MNIFKTKSNVISYTINKAVATECYVSVEAGEVVVNVPWYFSRKQIQSIIEEKRQWILNKIEEYQQANRVFTDKGTIFVLGAAHQVRLFYKNISSPSINLINRTIEIVLPNKYKKVETNQILKILVEKLYQKVAEQEIERAMEKTRLLLGYAPEDYEIANLSNNVIAFCSSEEQKISISSNIAKYDRNVIDYIVLHEFCHLKYKIHAKNFWKIIKKYMPSYERYEKVLKDFTY